MIQNSSIYRQFQVACVSVCPSSCEDERPSSSLRWDGMRRSSRPRRGSPSESDVVRHDNNQSQAKDSGDNHSHDGFSVTPAGLWGNDGGNVEDVPSDFGLVPKQQHFLGFILRISDKIRDYICFISTEEQSHDLPSLRNNSKQSAALFWHHRTFNFHTRVLWREFCGLSVDGVFSHAAVVVSFFGLNFQRKRQTGGQKRPAGTSQLVVAFEPGEDEFSAVFRRALHQDGAPVDLRLCDPDGWRADQSWTKININSASQLSQST